MAQRPAQRRRSDAPLPGIDALSGAGSCLLPHKHPRTHPSPPSTRLGENTHAAGLGFNEKHKETEVISQLALSCMPLPAAGRDRSPCS